ncbi:hydrolase CocE/NonD family protein [Rhodococcus opacus]|nr:hydrolase CocE/NonD family protein [Rhodococcus opacus]RKM77369.1 hydrolase CocE/NonD family protein [Rhodococcus opacus]
MHLWDSAPDGKRQLIMSGYLEASHHELDERTTEGNPHHPHSRAVPVEPGTIEEYVLRLYPFAATFRPGHSLTVELSNNEPPADAHNALLPPEAFHLPVGRPVTHKIYRDAAHRSRLVLPFTTPKAGGAEVAKLVSACVPAEYWPSASGSVTIDGWTAPPDSPSPSTGRADDACGAVVVSDR